MPIRATAKRITITLDYELLAWLDVEGFKRERERSYLIERALLQWQNRLERERMRRAERRRANGGG